MRAAVGSVVLVIGGLVACAEGATSAPVAKATSAIDAAGSSRSQGDVALNVLVVLLDDMGVDTVGAYTPGAAHTPNIDALARRGVRFTNAWSSPFCEPSRAALQTGRYGFRTGIGSVGKGGLPLEEVTIAEMLALGTAGRYATAAIGKWHLAGERNGRQDSPNRAGYGHFEGTLGNLDDYFRYRKVTNGVSSETTGYATSDQAKDALAWIRGASEPWFCYVAFNAVHHPVHAPPPRLHGVELPEDDPAAAAEAMFLAMIEALDHEVARLCDGLGDELRARTTVILLSDNGTNRNHLTDVADTSGGKGTVMQSGIHVPLIVAGPPVRAPGRTIDALVDVSDLFATVAELAGVDLDVVRPQLPGPLDSVSFARYLRSPDATPARTLAFAESFRPNGPGPYQNTRRALRDERYKLIELVRANGERTEELYDLLEDPDETRDLLAGAETDGTPDAARVRVTRDRLRAELDRLLASNRSR